MKFRKKPIVVEAYQLTEEKEINTREGTLKGYPGDSIITGIQGEQYPCGKEIFEQTYEPVESRPHTSSTEAPETLYTAGMVKARMEHIRNEMLDSFIDNIEGKLPRYPSDLGDMYLLSDIQSLRSTKEQPSEAIER